jgi:GTP-binding protein
LDTQATSSTNAQDGILTEGLRNVAIIAHVDHGKTTLVDKLLKATGAIASYQHLGERILDSNDLERERGITILAKNISIFYRGVKINLIDTPGHADFGGEVERVLRMADGVLLLVDAAEGPMPQTRFVLRKAFERRLRPIVVINKIDRPDARPEEVVDEVGELFLELASELGLDASGDLHVLDFPILFASAKEGYAKLRLEDPPVSVEPLLDAILEHVPTPRGTLEGSLQLQIASLAYSDYVGRIGIGRVFRGSVRAGDRVIASGKRGNRPAAIKELYIFDKLGRVPAAYVGVGDICAVTGIDDIEIGDTITDPENPDPLPITEVDRPTVSMIFRVNDSPFAGQDGRFVTSRHLRARLEKELESNVALRMKDAGEAGAFEVSGRGTLHLGVLIENMRREGYEFQVGKPRVIIIEEDGVKKEPVELLIVQAPASVSGRVIELMGARRGEMVKYEPQGERVLTEFKVPARGLIGVGSRLMNLTGGEALVFHSFHAYEPFKGPIPGRGQGVMVSSETGTAMPYALFGLKDRGPMFVEPGTKVYEGMIVGEHAKDNDISVNACREKKLTNVRAAGSDENVLLKPPRRMSIEEALEYIEEDELLEVTPLTYRLRKKVLNEKARRRAERSGGLGA